MAESVNETLENRGKRYGSFVGHADITQAIKNTMHAAPKWGHLRNDQREALEMVAHKIGRILNGDPDYADSWHDIAGYASLVDARLKGGGEMNKRMIETAEGWTAPTLRPPGSPPDPDPVPPAPITREELAEEWKDASRRGNLLGRQDVQRLVGEWLEGVKL